MSTAVERVEIKLAAATGMKFGSPAWDAKYHIGHGKGKANKSTVNAEGHKKPYGDVAYADPKNSKYPVNSKVRVLAAWRYINVAKNAAEYPLNGVALAEVKSNIIAAGKKFGLDLKS